MGQLGRVPYMSYAIDMCLLIHVWLLIVKPNIVQSNILHVIFNRHVFTNFLPCSHAINPNNETCLVTCAVSLTCATWLVYTQFSLFAYPSTRIQLWYT